MKERGRERKITSAASSIDPAPRDVHIWALWRYVFMDKFSPPWRQLPHFLCKQLQCAVQSSWPIWKWVRALWGSRWSCFSPTDPPFGPCLLLDLNPVAVLCCAGSQDPEQGHLSQKSSALPPLWPLLQPHPIVSHSMSLPAVPVGSVAVRPSLFKTCNRSLVPGLLQGCLYRCVAAACAVSK